MTNKEEFLEAFCARKKFFPNAKPEKFLNYKDLSSFSVSADQRSVVKLYAVLRAFWQMITSNF